MAASVTPSGPPGDDVLLSVRDLRAYFHTDGGVVRAVDGVGFDVAPGEVLAVVGESGSGKSVTGLTIMGLLPRPEGRVETGEVWWRGKDLVQAKDSALRRIRGAEISMIFQDPMTALNPVFTVGAQIVEMVRAHENLSRKAAKDRAADMLAAVGIPQPRERLAMYPHEFSGGMRQRAMIAMAIACDPDLIIADEPTTALDVTVQSQVLEVLAEARERTRAGMILITHDLGIVAGVADRVMVMYAGRQVEVGDVDDVFYDIRHPYTRGLLGSLPRADATSGTTRLEPIPGHPPSLLNPPRGCMFHPRCYRAELPSPCATNDPSLREVRQSHAAACHFAGEVTSVSLDAAQGAAGAPDAGSDADLTVGVPEGQPVGAPDAAQGVVDAEGAGLPGSGSGVEQTRADVGPGGQPQGSD
ncbi:MAG: ABC transporter ATP-binding protein [Acidimicrobiales bacterium]